MSNTNGDKFGVMSIIGIVVGALVGIYLIILGHTFLGGIAGFAIFFIFRGVDLVIQEQSAKGNKKVKIIGFGALVAVFIIVLLLLLGSACDSCTEHESQYDDVFNKDPNTWTDDEEEYVNDLFEWIDEQD